jgi:hypothetical protein
MYLDDIREPDGSYTYAARSSDEAILIMDIGCPDFISFDHDLGEEDTAMNVVKYMVEKDLDNPGWIPYDFSYKVHSANPVGKENIIGYLNSYLSQRILKD